MNCKPGDMAIVVNVYNQEKNNLIGKIVSVVCQMPHPRDPKHGDWLCNLNGQDAYINDENLRPIRPDETPEESIEAMKKLHDIEKEKV